MKSGKVINNSREPNIIISLLSVLSLQAAHIRNTFKITSSFLFPLAEMMLSAFCIAQQHATARAVVTQLELYLDTGRYIFTDSCTSMPI